MKKRMVRNILICLSCLCLLALSGCGLFGDELSGDGQTGNEQTGNEQINDEQISNKQSGSDYWVGAHWNVYYDGQVEFSDEYAVSGVTTTADWRLTESQMTELYHILTGSFQEYEYDNSICDGTMWLLTFYNPEGEAEHEFRGYIEPVDTMQEVVKIANDGEESNYY